MPARAIFANMTPRGRIVLAVSALAILGIALLMFRLASAPSYTTVLTGLDPAQTGKITQALDSKGIGYEIQNGGTALAVDRGKVSQARVALAEQGLPGTPQPGFELFDKQKLGTSQFQQQVTYQRALEGQIASTIDQIQGVSGASVQLVLPDSTDQLFATNQPQATAAVLLAGSTNLDPSTVQGIARLVANSVKGLKPENVTITDGSGQLLWPNGASAAGTGTGPLLAKLSAETRYDQTMQSSLEAMLAQTLGPGKAQVQVNANLDTNQATQETLKYARVGVPLQQHTDTETLRGSGTGTPAGAAGNIPGYTVAAGGGTNNYNHKVTDTTLGVDKTVTRTQIAPGTVKQLSVAVLVDSSVPAKSLPAIRSAVASAAGITPTRGDKLSVAQVEFAKPPVAKAASPVTPGKLLGYAKYLLLGLLTLAFLFFVSRHLRKRETETVEPTWLREISAPRALRELENAQKTVELPRPRQPETEDERNRAAVESLVDREPDRVAQQVRTWMHDD